MKRLLLITFALFTLVLATQAQVGDISRSTPAEQGVDTRAVIDFLNAIGNVPETELHHVMIARHGHVIAEMHPAPFSNIDGHTLYSESKTFASMGVGIAIGENRLRLTDRVATFFPDKLPDTISDALAQMTVRDLLIMASGIKPDWDLRKLSSDWIRDWLAKPVTNKPGKKFDYDSLCTFMLSAIVQRVTGLTLLEYLNEKLFTPMHITEVDWEESPDGISTGGWGLRLQAESQLKMGLLLLGHGNWQGKQLIPASWIEDAIKPHIRYEWYKDTDAPTEGNQGYGYQIWRCKWPTAFRADGAYGQFIVCVPESDLVVVINMVTSHTHGHDVLGCIWNNLLPGMHDSPLKVDRKAQHDLENKCLNNTLLPVATTQKSKRQLPITLQLEDNKHNFSSITIDKDNQIVLDYTNAPQETFTYGALSFKKQDYRGPQWVRSSLEGMPPYSIKPLSYNCGLKHNFEASTMFGWTDDDHAVIDIYYVNWISHTTITINFADNTITILDNFDIDNPETVHFKRVP